MKIEQIKSLKRIHSLLLKSIGNRLEQEEAEELKKWRETSEANEQLWQNLQKETYLRKRYTEFCQSRYPNGWKNVKSRIRQEKTVPLWKRVTKYAALLILLLGAGWLLQTQFRNIPDQPQELPLAEIHPGSTRAILELGNGKQIALNQNAAQPVQELKKVGITLHQKELIYQNTLTLPQAAEHTLRVPRGGEYKLTLADGSTVWMNSGSVLRYPIRFNGKERRVKIEGEAYFQVAKNPKQPFIVESGTLKICVTGTEFNVKAYPEDQEIVTTLVTGGVNIRNNGQNISLSPNFQASANRLNNEIEVHRVNTSLYTSWKDGVFEFEDMPLEEICRQLGRWYDVEFIFTDPAIRTLSFTGAAKREKSIEFILNIIGNTNAIHFDIQNDKRIILSKK